jgi:hypothetical protein
VARGSRSKSKPSPRDKADDLLTAFLSLKRDAIVPKGANGNATRQNVT